MQLADRELSSFITAVTELYGRDQAELSAQNWLEESELMEGPPRSGERDWRAVTIAAAARLAIESMPGPRPLNTTDTNISQYQLGNSLHVSGEQSG